MDWAATHSKLRPEIFWKRLAICPEILSSLRCQERMAWETLSNVTRRFVYSLKYLLLSQLAFSSPKKFISDPQERISHINVKRGRF